MRAQQNLSSFPVRSEECTPNAERLENHVPGGAPDADVSRFGKNLFSIDATTT